MSMAGLLLELQGDVLGDVAEPGALAQPLDEAALASARAGVLGQPGQQAEQPVDEAREGVGGVVLERAEVDEQVDRRARRTRRWGRGRPASRRS
jgi:hypothetical protein